MAAAPYKKSLGGARSRWTTKRAQSGRRVSAPGVADPQHGGACRNPKSFQAAQLTYDVTARRRTSHRRAQPQPTTRWQVWRAQVSGIPPPRWASGLRLRHSKKMQRAEADQRARASLEELRLRLRGTLRQRGCPQWVARDLAAVRRWWKVAVPPLTGGGVGPAYEYRNGMDRRSVVEQSIESIPKDRLTKISCERRTGSDE